MAHPATSVLDARATSTEDDEHGLSIAVMSGVGHGETPLAAFDAALYLCGAHNYNVIALSSVIPPASTVTVCQRREAEGEYGHRLYVVKAEIRASEPGAVIAAGLGWLQAADGRGVFVEHELRASSGARDEIERDLAAEIDSSLRSLAAVRGIPFSESHTGKRLVSARVASRPTCALVLAVYQSEPWRPSL